jgi:hypothetical protein
VDGKDNLSQYGNVSESVHNFKTAEKTENNTN